ncbi:MAG: sigma-70 family RNA polymerase sigma factor [Saprospiraceae bacterium]|nr:sigma-70 family RNA polymerase sigma factor [Saprospiraceae bacterium]
MLQSKILTFPSFATMKYSDADIISMIISSDSSRKQAIEYVYSWENLKVKIHNFVLRRGGSHTDGLDVFHEGIIALDRNIRRGVFKAESSIEGYLYSICRFIWNNEWRKKKKITTHNSVETDQNHDEVTPEIRLFAKEEKMMLRGILDLLDDSCRKILTLWKQSYSMDEIARDLNLSSAQLAKKYKYRCLKKLMVVLEKKPELLNALKDE